MIGNIRLRINLSSNFAKNDKRLIERWEDSRSGDLFGLGTNSMVDYFQSSGI